jgi:hypothetical protein
MALALPVLTLIRASAQNVSGVAARDAGFKVVENGAAQAVIVTANAPSAVVRYAAMELQRHIERATGARLEIVAEKDAASSKLPHRIYVGPSAATEKAGIHADALPLNAFSRQATDSAIFLVGKDTSGRADDPSTASRARSWTGFEVGAPPLDDSASMGSLFAVYEWLENQLGVRWLWPGESGTVIPKTKTVFAGAVGAQRILPALMHSQPRLNTWAGMDPNRREKYIYDTSVWLRRQRFARGVSFHYGHAFTKYWERFGSTHPEYFALRPDGVRAPFDPKRPNLVQMCVSQPALHRQIVADWLIQRKENPSLPWINGIENDKTANDPACTCEVCRSWDAKNRVLEKENQWLSGKQADGKASAPTVSLSDRYARFWLALQEEGKKHDPNATVIGYAYADYSEPPVETRLNKNIIVGIVPSYTFPLDEAKRDSFRALWDGWAKTGASLYLRPNYFLSGYDMPYNFAEQFGEEFKYASQHGMIATDFDSLLGMWGVQGINLYMMGRLNAHPDLSVAEVLDEYYAGFGGAKDAVRRYFEHWKKVTDKADDDFKARSKGGWGFVSKAGDEIYTPQTFETGQALLREAKNATSDDPEARARVEFLQLWLDHAQLSMWVLAAFHAQREESKDAKLKADFETAKTALDTFREAHADDIVNVGVLRQLEVWSGWRKSAELVR